MFGEIKIEENEAFLSGTDTVASFGSHLSPVTIENTQRGYHKGHSLKISSRNCNVRCTMGRRKYVGEFIRGVKDRERVLG